jgi:hypothetical protein
MKGKGQYSVFAQNKLATDAFFKHRFDSKTKPKLCWKCQKESSYEDGAYLRFASGVHQYICKPCMDIKREKQKLKEESNA